MITFILMEPEVAGNVGAIARVMKNFGFTKLVIINPKCDIHSDEAMGRSKHARDILKKAKIAKPDILKSFHTLICTTAILGSDYNIPRCPLTPSQLGTILPEKAFSLKGPNIAILFGREGPGLTNEEVLASDFIVTIPSQKTYPTLNLSHAVAIIAYELSTHRSGIKVNSNIPLVSGPERRQMLKLLDQVLDTIDFGTEERKETQRRVWKRIFAKSFVTRREALAVMGLWRLLLRDS